MKKLIECIPNFSEGRDKAKISSIIKAITDVPGIVLLDKESDPDHNRSVVTFAGEPRAVLEAAFQGIRKASELIDMDQHKGEHPRMGATDVCPLVPLGGVKMGECVKYAEKLGERVGEELGIPIYLYEKAARTPARENLADVRKGEYEGIKTEIAENPERAPDFGPKEVGSAGATAIGAREVLVAYNVNLATSDLKIAKAIAKTVRFKNGGFKHVKALGFALEDKGIVQVSMNLVNYKESTIHHVFEAIKREAHRYGVHVPESEVIGLIPEKALFEASKYYLQINDFKNKQILERVLRKKMEGAGDYLDGFIDKVASKKPVPGGGSVAALAGTLAAALTEMVANLTLAGKKYAEVHGEMEELFGKAEELRKKLYKLIKEDADAYKQVVKACKSGEGVQEALKLAASTPLKTAKTALEILDLIQLAVEKGNPNAVSDCGVALYMVEGAVKGALLNVHINLPEITDENFSQKMKDESTQIKETLSQKAEKLDELILTKLA